MPISVIADSKRIVLSYLKLKSGGGVTQNVETEEVFCIKLCRVLPLSFLKRTPNLRGTMVPVLWAWLELFHP